VFGKPAIFWLGIVTILAFLLTAATGWLSYKEKAGIGIKWHIRFAALGIIFAAIHGLLGIAAYF
jgi:hypothetical protein